MGKEEAEIDAMKVKDLFETAPLLTGRTEIDTVSKLNTGLVWSCPGVNFLPDQSADGYEFNSGQMTNSGSSNPMAPVFLPNGATITNAIVYSSNTSRVWSLIRLTISDGTNLTIGTANSDSEDTSISNATVDNLTYAYFLQVVSMTSSEVVRGARITYTI